MKRQSFDNFWDALKEIAVASANMTLRYDLLFAIQQEVLGWRVTQSSAAARLGVTQPRVNDLLQGRIANCSLDARINFAGVAGPTVRLSIARAA